MKTVTGLITMLLVTALPVSDAAVAARLDGHSWEQMDGSCKILLMAGYVSGFRHGTMYGADFGVNASSTYLKDIGKTVVYGVRKFKEYSRCGASVDKNREAVLRAAGRHARDSLNKPIEYYVGEVDAFYGKYPACRGEDLMSMLTEISLAWLRIRTYRDIGKECSKVAGGGAHEGGFDE